MWCFFRRAKNLFNKLDETPLAFINACENFHWMTADNAAAFKGEDDKIKLSAQILIKVLLAEILIKVMIVRLTCSKFFLGTKKFIVERCSTLSNLVFCGSRFL